MALRQRTERAFAWFLFACYATSPGFRTVASPGFEEQQRVVEDTFDDAIWKSSPLYERALSLMQESPLIDTHIDLPQVIRSLGAYARTAWASRIHTYGHS